MMKTVETRYGEELDLDDMRTEGVKMECFVWDLIQSCKRLLT